MYGNAADFITYHTDRGRTIPGTWDNDYIEAALLVASEWLDAKFDKLWVGYAVGGYSQTRKWPRASAVTNTFPATVLADTVIPQEILNGTYEAAWRETNNAGSLNLDYTPSKYRSVRIEGAISVEYDTTVTHGSDVQTQIGIINNLMESLIDPIKFGNYASLSGKAERV